ncbi:SICAvar, type I (fragment), partial [Plasmodium knowlesi strain H]
GKPCTNNGETLCNQLQCVADKWGVNRQEGKNPTWNRMESDFRTQLTNLLSGMQDQRKQDPDAKYCNHDTNNQKWDESDAHDAANKTACKLVAAGLQHISSIQGSYSVSEKTPYDNQEFKQFVSCLMLRAVAQQMKEKSIICNIQPGIDAAFAKAGAIKKDHCTNNKPCIVCTLDDRTKDELNDCTIPNGKGPHVNVKPKLESLLTGEESNVNKTIQDLLKTDKSGTLCQRLQCLSSKVDALKSQSQSNA